MSLKLRFTLLFLAILMMATITLQGILPNKLGTIFRNRNKNNYNRLVFVDTDGGSDDLVALMQLIRDPNTDVLGISCTYGNVDLDQACSNILRILNLLERTDIPVYPGCDSPLTSAAVYDGWYGADGMGNSSSLYPLPDNVKLQPIHAAFAMLGSVIEYPGQVTMLSLAPLTTLAVVLKLDPFFSNKLKDHIVMGGTMKAVGNVQPTAEFNFYDDPEAAVIVFNKTAFPITVVPFELTFNSGPTWDIYNEWMKMKTEETILVDRLFKMANEKLQSVNSTRFNPIDLLAATVLVAGPQVVTDSTFRTAAVEQCGMITRGEFVVDYRTMSTPEVANVHLITEINSEAVVKIWKKLFSR